MAINSIPGDPSANSYISIAEADDYFYGVLNSSAWPKYDGYIDNEETLLKKEASLRESTRVLDSLFRWYGSVSSSNQALRWPRTGTIDSDGRSIPNDIIPKQIKDGTCELALFLLQGGGLTVSESNLTRLKVGPIGLDFSEDVGTTVGVPDYIIKSLVNFGKYTGPLQNSILNVSAVRA